MHPSWKQIGIVDPREKLAEACGEVSALQAALEEVLAAVPPESKAHQIARSALLASTLRGF